MTATAATPRAWPTDGTAAVAPAPGPDGSPLVSVLVKRTYVLRPNAEPVPVDKPVPLVIVDQFYDDGDPQVVPVRLEAETAPYKPATDVVVVGTAWAPGLRPVQQLDAAVEIGAVKKTIRVVGDRRCEHRVGRSPTFTDPEPFTEMPVRYDRAYGGLDAVSVPGTTAMYPRNPRGTGFVLANEKARVNGLRLPNLEDPADRLTPDRLILGEPDRWHAMPLPQGFGYYPKLAYPRTIFAGVYPAFVAPGLLLKEEELGLVPKDHIALAKQFRLPSFDVRFNNSASLGLTVPFLAGGERIRLTNLTPDGVLTFPLPRERPKLALDLGKGWNELPAVLHTVLIRADEGRLDLIWRGSMSCPVRGRVPVIDRLVAEAVWP